MRSDKSVLQAEAFPIPYTLTSNTVMKKETFSPHLNFFLNNLTNIFVYFVQVPKHVQDDKKDRIKL